MLEATRALLRETSYDDVTIQGIAAEAGLNRRYVHRTWGSKAELVRDALLEGATMFRAADTGSLEGDLRDLISQQVDLILRPEFLNGISGVEVAHRTTPDILGETMDRFVTPSSAAMQEVLERAHQRGEIQTIPDPTVTITAISGAIRQVWAIRKLDRDELGDLGVAMVVGGLADS